MQTKPLPSVFALFKESLELIGAYRGFFLGYSAWIFVPMIASVLGAVTLSSDTAAIIDTISSIFYITIVQLIIIIFIINIPNIKNEKEIEMPSNKQLLQLFTLSILLVILLSTVITLGFIVLIIPGIILGVRLGFAFYALIVERLAIFESIKRSKALVKGRFWQVMWRQYGGGILISIPYLIIILAAIYIFVSGPEGFNVFDDYKNVVYLEIISRILEFFLIPISTIYGTLLFLALKD